METEVSFYKPAGYSTVSPYLIVDGAAATITFLVQVFGAVVLTQVPDDIGKLKHSEVRLDDSVLMIADQGEGWPAMHSHVHSYVENFLLEWKSYMSETSMMEGWEA